MLLALVKEADLEFEGMKNTNVSLEEVEDLKIYLTRGRLISIIGSELVEKYERKFVPDYNTIILRRCQAYGKNIKFHVD